MSIDGGAVPNTLLAVYCCLATVVVYISLVTRLRFNVESGRGSELSRYFMIVVVRIWRGGTGSCVRWKFGCDI